MSSTKDKFKQAFAKFKSEKPPLDPREIDKMEEEDEKKLVLLTNWADETEELLRGLHNPQIKGEMHQDKNVTAYKYTGPKQTIKQSDWGDLIDQALKDPPTDENIAKQLMWKLNALQGVSSLLGQGNTYAKRFAKARDLKFLIRLCNNR